MVRLVVWAFCLASLYSSIGCFSQVSATTYNLTPASPWVSILNNSSYLSPGDELVFSAGTYYTTTRLSIGYHGTQENPITIRAADGAEVILKRNAAQNVINIEGARYLKLQGLEITGGSAGIRIGGGGGSPAKFITLDGNHIHHTAEAAVTANFYGQSYEGMHFLNNEIDHTSGTGEGFYLGCNNNGCQFFDGIIERNYIHHLDGPGVSQGDGIEIKDGSYNNMIRDNVIHDTNYPGILVYGVEEQGARNIIERNTIWNSGDHAIQAAADAIIRNNLIFSSTFDGIHSHNHQGAIPGNLTIENNTIRTGRYAIDIGYPTGGVYSGAIEIANNALYPIGTYAIDTSIQANLTVSSNVGTGFATAGLPVSAFDNSGNLNTDFVDFQNRNAFPAVGSKLIGSGNPSLQPADDYNTTSRSDTADVGAYVFAANGNPGWQVGPGFKQFPPEEILGDYDSDGDVDGIDFLVWQQGGSPNGATSGDLMLWQGNFGTAQANGAVANVPETVGLVPLLAGFVAMLMRCFIP